MPNYDYKCTYCGYVIEMNVDSDDKRKFNCPECYRLLSLKRQPCAPNLDKTKLREWSK